PGKRGRPRGHSIGEVVEPVHRVHARALPGVPGSSIPGVLAARLCARSGRRVHAAAARGVALRGVGLLAGAVRGAAVFGLVEPRALEAQPGAGADDPLELALLARRALALRAVLHALEQLEAVPAGIALVVVGRHRRSLLPSPSGPVRLVAGSFSPLAGLA